MSKHEFITLPNVGAWRLRGAYEGYEVVRFTQKDSTLFIEGTSVGVEEDVPWSIHYALEITNTWHFRRATVTDYAGNELSILVDGAGSWTVNGLPSPELAGCVDIDFEASAVTNTLPVHRLALPIGQRGESTAAYIRTKGLKVERLDQSYTRLPDVDNKIRFDYTSPRFGYHDMLQFDRDGLVNTYPGIAVRKK